MSKHLRHSFSFTTSEHFEAVQEKDDHFVTAYYYGNLTTAERLAMLEGYLVHIAEMIEYVMRSEGKSKKIISTHIAERDQEQRKRAEEYLKVSTCLIAKFEDDKMCVRRLLIGEFYPIDLAKIIVSYLE